MTDLDSRLRDQSWRDGRKVNMAELEVWNAACCEAADRIVALEAEVERLRAELDLAIALIRNRERRTWGWNERELSHGYFIDGQWAGATLEDAISKAAELEGGK